MEAFRNLFKTNTVTVFNLTNDKPDSPLFTSTFIVVLVYFRKTFTSWMTEVVTS